MATKSKIPEKLYVVSKLTRETVGRYDELGPGTGYQYEDHNFGFLHPHEPHAKTDSDRKETQHSWAYSGTQYQIGDQWWVKGAEWDYTTQARVYFDRPIDPLYAPRVWINEPLDGFRIIDTVNRYRGNKLFKVLDPRGIEFELTVASLFTIITDGTIDRGCILSKCVWKTNKNLVVVG